MVAGAAAARRLHRHRPGRSGGRDARRRFRLYRLAFPGQPRRPIRAEAFKQMVVEGGAADIIVTKAFTGARASFLAPSLRANGLDPDAIARKDPERVDISGEASQGKPWRDIWSAGQGIGAVKASLPAAEWIAALAADYAKRARRHGDEGHEISPRGARLASARRRAGGEFRKSRSVRAQASPGRTDSACATRSCRSSRRCAAGSPIKGNYSAPVEIGSTMRSLAVGDGRRIPASRVARWRGRDRLVRLAGIGRGRAGRGRAPRVRRPTCRTRSRLASWDQRRHRA